MVSLLFLFLWPSVFGSFTNCAKYPALLPIHELYADPKSAVAINQKVHFRISFTIPLDIYIPSAILQFRSVINAIPMKPIKFPYTLTSLTPNTYDANYTFDFPPGVWGRIQTDISVYNMSGKELLCARWIVYATNTDTNVTSWFLSAFE
jgi:hypothetical protein